MDKIEIPGYRYSLQRDRDDAGDSGPWLEAFDWDNPNAEHEQGVIEVGKGVRVGSLYARTMQAQDWWLTTPVGEILSHETDEESDGGTIHFTTQNGSSYTLRYF